MFPESRLVVVEFVSATTSFFVLATSLAEHGEPVVKVADSQLRLYSQHAKPPLRLAECRFERPFLLVLSHFHG